jgi:hypothetical protein
MNDKGISSNDLYRLWHVRELLPRVEWDDLMKSIPENGGKDCVMESRSTSL